MFPYSALYLMLSLISRLDSRRSKKLEMLPCEANQSVGLETETNKRPHLNFEFDLMKFVATNRDFYVMQ